MKIGGVYMTFFNDKLSVVSDSLDNILLFRREEGNISLNLFNNKTKISTKEEIVKGILQEYDVSIDSKGDIYLTYQDDTMNLVLTILRGDGDDREDVKLTAEPIPEVYDLHILNNKEEPHIIYFIMLPDERKRYRMYHHYFNGDEWITHIVDEVRVKQILNPMKIIKENDKIILGYYKYEEQEEIYYKEFDLDKKQWMNSLPLTNNGADRLYLDMLKDEDHVHLTYSEYYNGNFIVKYEKFSYGTDGFKKDMEEILSNEENPSNPTLIYYEDKMWIAWIEYDNVMSRYSENGGLTWSPIYLWNESKEADIVRYKCLNKDNKDNIILNHYFGRVNPEIVFIGFGSVENATEVPIKKK